MKGKDDKDMDFPDFEEESLDDNEISKKNNSEENIEDIFNGSFEEDLENIPVLEEEVKSINENTSFEEFSFDDVEDLENPKNEFEEFSFDEVVESAETDDFDFDEVNEKSETKEEFSFDEVVESAETDDFDFDEVTEKDSFENSKDTSEFEELVSNIEEDFNFGDEKNEENEEFKGTEMSSKDRSNIDDDFEFETNDDFEFEEESNISTNENFDFEDESNISTNEEFSFEEDSNSKDEDFNTSYNFEENNSDVDSDIEDHTPRVLKDDDNNEESNEEKKSSANKIKLILGIISVVLLILGGSIGWKVFNSSMLEYEEEKETETEVESKPNKNIKKQEILSEEIDLIEEPKEVIKKSSEKNIVEPKIEFNEVSQNKEYEEKYNKLNGQFETVIKNMSSLSSKISSVESENMRLKKIVSDLKNSPQSNGKFENFELDFSKIKSEVSTIKEQIDNEKSYNKETMIKFLQISKKLREEILVLKSKQVDKSIIEEKLLEIDQLNKQFEILSNKVSNNEVLNKLTTLEKEITANKLAEVEKQVIQNNKQVQKTVNGKKSVLELLEEKNKEKDIESSSTIIEEEELRIPLSVTIEDDYEDRPIVKKQKVKKPIKNVYKFIGTIEGVVYLKNSSGSISEYRIRDHLPGYGEILKIYKDGTIETEDGPLNFK